MPISRTPVAAWPTGNIFQEKAITDSVLGGAGSASNIPIEEAQDALLFLYNRRSFTGAITALASYYIAFLKDAAISSTEPLVKDGTNLQANQLIFWDRGRRCSSPSNTTAFTFSNATGATHYYQLYVRRDGSTSYVFSYYDYGTSSSGIDDDLQAGYGAYLGYVEVAAGANVGAGSSVLNLQDENPAFPDGRKVQTVTVSTGTTHTNFFVDTMFLTSNGAIKQPFDYSASGGTVTIEVSSLEAGSFNYVVTDSDV